MWQGGAAAGRGSSTLVGGGGVGLSVAPLKGIWGGSRSVWARGMMGGMMYGGMVGHGCIGVWVVGQRGVVSNCECNWHQ